MTAETSGPYLKVENVTKKFGDFAAIADVDLEVREREFVCFLGPSGCGKTTLLRAIAGLDIQSSGRIYQKGRDISALPPAERDFGIVFQSYALFPNLTVRKNVAYGLENRRVGRQAIDARVDELLQLVGMPEQGAKYPAQLSGGQQQRVALARALATEPGLLLLDEPLSALDAKVRLHLRQEIKDLQEKLGVTTIMVTHDQEEALTMADRIVVMNEGRIEQVGTPIEIYRDPASVFVADFVGTTNFIHGTVAGPGRIRVGEIVLGVGVAGNGFSEGAAVTVCIRPEEIVVGRWIEDNAHSFDAEVEHVEFLGPSLRIHLRAVGGGDARFAVDLSALGAREMGLETGNVIKVSLPMDNMHIYPGDG